MPKTIIFPYPFKEQCDMALCSRPKEYTIAVEGSHPSLFFGICGYHMESLLDAIAKHPKLGHMMADKLIVGDNPEEVGANQTDQPDDGGEGKKPKQQKIAQDKKIKDTAICPYCNKTFKSSELRRHMKQCNAGGESG